MRRTIRVRLPGLALAAMLLLLLSFRESTGQSTPMRLREIHRQQIGNTARTLRFSDTVPHRLAVAWDGPVEPEPGVPSSGIVIYEVPSMRPIDTIDERSSEVAFTRNGLSLITASGTAPDNLSIVRWEIGHRNQWGGDSIRERIDYPGANINRIVSGKSDGRLYVAGTLGVWVYHLIPRLMFADTALHLRVLNGEALTSDALDVAISQRGTNFMSTDSTVGLLSWNGGTNRILRWAYGEGGHGWVDHHMSIDLVLSSRNDTVGADTAFIKERDHDVFNVGGSVGFPYAWRSLDGHYCLDDKLVVVSCADTMLRVWDLKRRELVEAFRPHEGPFLLEVNYDGHYVATLGEDGLLRVFEFASSDIDEVADAEAPLHLEEPRPNPTSDRIVARFRTGYAGTFTIRIIDLFGREIVSTGGEYFDAGSHRKEFVLDGAPSGIYYLVVEEEKGGRAVQPVRIVR